MTIAVSLPAGDGMQRKLCGHWGFAGFRKLDMRCKPIYHRSLGNVAQVVAYFDLTAYLLAAFSFTAGSLVVALCERPKSLAVFSAVAS